MLSTALFTTLAVSLAWYWMAVVSEEGVPDGVLRYIRKSILLGIRRFQLSSSQEEDAYQEVLARLWELENDLDGWVSFSNRDLDSPIYQRFRDHLIKTLQSVIDRMGRTPRIEVKHGALGYDPDVPPKKRQRDYLPPDRSLSDAEAGTIPSREPSTGLRDLTIDLQAAINDLPEQCRGIVLRKTISGETWETIASHFGLTVAQAQRECERGFALLTGALKGYRDHRD
jgi:DNA-directed RNA polymerase specialized sigma24 family protein